MATVKAQGGGGTLAEVIDVILDKGIVVDVWARVSLIGIEILTIEARVVIASVETYLRYADAIGVTATAAAPTPRTSRRTAAMARETAGRTVGEAVPEGVGEAEPEADRKKREMVQSLIRGLSDEELMKKSPEELEALSEMVSGVAAKA